MNEFLGTKEDILKELNINPKIGLTEETKKLSLEKYGKNSFTKPSLCWLSPWLCTICCHTASI